MKRIIILTFIMSALLLTSCTDDSSLGIIGGADGPTAIFVSSGKDNNVRMTFGEQYEKTTIRMFNVDGELYYDSGLVSDMTPRCGTLDGNLKKGVKENEIPHKSGESNFDIDGYQNATGITKEVNIDGEWVIFRKYKNLPQDIDDLKYCYYIKGHLNNAATDSEIVVLTDSEEVTFNDVYEPLLSSQEPVGKDFCRASHNMINGDEWGLNISEYNVTNTGMTLKFEQFGGTHTGQLQTGEWYKIETTVNDEWQDVKTVISNYAFDAVAYLIKKNDITEFEVNWEWLYGKLSPGFYRMSKEVINFRETGDFDKEIYIVHFTIE